MQVFQLSLEENVCTINPWEAFRANHTDIERSPGLWLGPGANTRLPEIRPLSFDAISCNVRVGLTRPSSRGTTIDALGRALTRLRCGSALTLKDDFWIALLTVSVATMAAVLFKAWLRPLSSGFGKPVADFADTVACAALMV